MAKSPVLLTLSALLLASIALAACENRYRGHEPKASPPPASSVPKQQPLLSVPATALKWDKPGVSDQQRQADIESCYAFAEATVAHDIRIEDDRDSGRFDRDRGFGDVNLRHRMRAFGQRNQRTRLINDCMTRKGYQATE